MSRSTTTVRTTVAVAAAAAALLSACSSSKSSTGAGAGSTTAGGGSSITISTTAGRLVGPNGHTLYENTVDTASKISCTGACAAEWPPLTGNPVVSGGLNTSDFATAARPDGSMQVTFQGHPLYYFADDKSAGSTKGDGEADQGGSWHIATAAPVSTTGGTSSAPPTMSDSSGSGYGGGGY
jgi:predicted lipoprotein with Yx(FWY)xxD motif